MVIKMRTIKKLNPKARDIYTAGSVLSGVWSVKLEDVIKTDPLHVFDCRSINDMTKKMRLHTRDIKIALAKGITKGSNLRALFDKTKQLYERGMHQIIDLRKTAEVEQILDSAGRFVHSFGMLDDFWVTHTMESGFPQVIHRNEDSRRWESAELHWEAHSEMMRVFAEFQEKYRTELKEVLRAGRT